MADFSHLTSSTFLALSAFFIILLLFALRKDIEDIKNISKKLNEANNNTLNNSNNNIELNNNINNNALNNVNNVNNVNNNDNILIYNKKKARITKITKASKQGAVRGAITGLIIYGVPGSIAGGIIFGVSSGLTALI